MERRVIDALSNRVDALQRQLDEQEARHAAEKAALLEAYHTAEERLRRKAFELAVTKFECDAALARYADEDTPGARTAVERTVASSQIQSPPKTDVSAWGTAPRRSAASRT